MHLQRSALPASSRVVIRLQVSETETRLNVTVAMQRPQWRTTVDRLDRPSPYYNNKVSNSLTGAGAAADAITRTKGGDLTAMKRVRAMQTYQRPRIP
jgi:hypothetical protein